MPIKSGDIKLLKAQVQLDTPDGGGAITADEVIDGLSNNLFPDISELDRTYGRISMRKVFPAIHTDDTDSFFGSHVIIKKLPEDPKVNVTLFTTKDWNDRRTAARNKIESYLARGPKWAGHLLEMQLEGQRAIQLAMRQGDEEPKAGQGLCLVQDEGKPTEREQYVRVMKVSSKDRVFTYNNQDITRKVVTVDISDPLRYDFEGQTVQNFEGNIQSRAVLRDTRVANAASYYGASRLVSKSKINDRTIQVKSIFSQLVPSSRTEDSLVDLTAAGASSLVVPASVDPITLSVQASITNNSKIFIGGPVLPGSLSFSLGADAVIDRAGELKAGSTTIGSIEYDKGVLNFNQNTIQYSGTVSITFRPGATPSRVNDTASISIVQDTRGYNYTITLLPIPQPGSLSVSYMSQGKVYSLHDRGDGALKGSDAAFGTGNINFSTGSVILTTGALPDAGSGIIFSWGKKSSTFVRSDLQVKPAKMTMTLANKQCAPGSVSISWKVGNVQKIASDDGNGKITGDATGTINYANSVIELVPSKLFQQGTEFIVTYQFGPANEHKFEMPIRDLSGDVNVILPNVGGAVIPKTVELSWNVDILDSPELGQIITEQSWEPPPEPFRRDPIVAAVDNGLGGFRRADGVLHAATINYSTRAIKLSPEFNVSIPKPVWGKRQIGEQRNGESGGVLVTRTYRRIIESWQMVETIATMPIGESGYLLVKWRTDASATSATETFTAEALRFDLTPGFAEDILQGSVRFVLGGKTYVDRLGTLYHSIDPMTGAGTVAGTIAYQSGGVAITDWTSGADNVLTLQSLVTEMNVNPVDEIVFRVPIAPVQPGSVQVRAVPIEGNEGKPINVREDSAGKIFSPFMMGEVDHQSGVVRIRFGQKLTVTPAIQAAPWYDENAVFTEGGVQKIIKPRPVYADSIRYNATVYTYLPLSAEVLGLDTVRLPSDGRVAVFRVGDVVVVHHTDKTAFPAAPFAGAMLDVGRERTSYIKVIDSEGTALDPEMYKTDPDAGTVTLKSNFLLGALKLPLYAEHQIEDMAVVTDVQINGLMTLNIPLTHNYPDTGVLVSSALIMGDLQARVHNLFSQESWTKDWPDSQVGNPTTAQYNDELYPIKVTNKGAIQERWAIIFTSNTTFRVIGKNVGQIAVGDVNTDLSPRNPATGVSYFQMKALGFGSGWAAGNVIFFETAAANYPNYLARTVLQGKPTALNDRFQIQIRGDINR